MVDHARDEAIKARQEYEALKKEYGAYDWPSPHRKLEVKPETTLVEKKLSIRDMKRVMMPLVPGQEITWATMMEQVVNRGIPGE